MVLPAKIFEITEELNLGLAAQKLKDHHEKESYTKEELIQYVREDILELIE